VIKEGRIGNLLFKFFPVNLNIKESYEKQFFQCLVDQP